MGVQMSPDARDCAFEFGFHNALFRLHLSLHSLSAMEQSDEELARLLQAQEYQTTAGLGALPRNGTSASPITLLEDQDDDNDGFTADLGPNADAPFKDLHGLFLAFNDQYFDSKLSACEVRWSPRMTRWYGPLPDCLSASVRSFVRSFVFVLCLSPQLSAHTSLPLASAGLCLYQSKAQYCSIRLSEPLLKFRPESDYIDTLLHEMIQ